MAKDDKRNDKKREPPEAPQAAVPSDPTESSTGPAGGSDASSTAFPSKSSRKRDAKRAKKEAREQGADGKRKLKRARYEAELQALQTELVKLQEWIRHKGLRVVVVFEGRDAAGKGGAIKRIVQQLNPRFCRIAALGTPTEREKTQWYFQRYVGHLPAAGEMVLFDRSWYNRAGVERVMGFCTDAE
ncbi:MAG: hypothetical protein MUF54_21155, partial [Polyangiaceae bacterium]|nr:hypothetical protein [Polyangiaceae bacterium]